jgi:hypothetical protein
MKKSVGTLTYLVAATTLCVLSVLFPVTGRAQTRRQQEATASKPLAPIFKTLVNFDGANGANRSSS